MKKKVLYLLILIISLMFIACDTDANQPDISKPEEAKTSISVILGFQDIEETGLLSLEVSILKGKDTIETFTLTSENNEKTIEVEAGEYAVQTTVLESGSSSKDYFCDLSYKEISVGKGDNINFVATISKDGTEPGGEGESESGSKAPVLTIDLCNPFNVDVNYSILPQTSPAEPLKTGTIKGNEKIEVPQGYLKYEFSVGEGYTITEYTVTAKQTYSKNISLFDGEEEFLSLFVESASAVDNPTLIFNLVQGAGLVGEENQYGDKVSITCTVEKENVFGSNVYQIEKEINNVSDDMMCTLSGTGRRKINFSITAKHMGELEETDVSDMYELKGPDGLSAPGTQQYVSNEYIFCHINILRKSD